jgi:hypothetical protein
MAFNLNNVISGARETVNDVTGQPSSDSNNFRRYLRNEHLGYPSATGTTDASSGQFTKIGEFIVPAQERYRLGFGSAKYEANQGYLYVELVDDASNVINGSIRIQQRDAQERNIRTAEELELSTLNASKSDRNQQIPFPEHTDMPKVGRDSKLVLAVNPDSDETIDWSASDVILPTTVYPVRNA